MNNSTPFNQEARNLVVSLRKRNYTNEEISVILNKLCFESTPQIVKRVYQAYEDKQRFKQRAKSTRAPPFSRLSEEKSLQMAYLFLNTQEMTVNKASKFFQMGKPQIRKLLQSFGIGCSKGKGQKFDRYTFKKYGKNLTEEERYTIFEEEQQRLMKAPIIQEPSPIDPLTPPIWKKVEIRIIFPKIRYGQVHQWERYYQRLTTEIQLENLIFIDFKDANQKFTGKGCYIYILAEYNQNVYLDNFTLEKFLENSMPEDFFAGNCLNTNKIRVFDFPYIIEEQPKEDLIDLNNPNKEEVFEQINSKIQNMNPQDKRNLDHLALQIHQYQSNNLGQAEQNGDSLSDEEQNRNNSNTNQIQSNNNLSNIKVQRSQLAEKLDVEKQNELLFKEMDLDMNQEFNCFLTTKLENAQ